MLKFRRRKSVNGPAAGQLYLITGRALLRSA